jgi:protoporphyrinogen oxidase
LGSKVNALALTPFGWEVGVATGESLIASELIVATEAGAAAKLLKGTNKQLAQALDAVVYAPLAVVHWQEKGREKEAVSLPRGFGYLAPRREQLFSVGTVFQSDLGPELKLPRRFTSFIGGALAPERAAMSDADLLLGVNADLQRLKAGQIGEQLAVMRYPTGIVQPLLGHGARMAEIGEQTKGLPLTLAGSYLAAGAMKDAIETGDAAAEAVVRHLDKVTRESVAAPVGQEAPW